jgi:hypothetical protein
MAKEADMLAVRVNRDSADFNRAYGWQIHAGF